MHQGRWFGKHSVWVLACLLVVIGLLWVLTTGGPADEDSSISARATIEKAKSIATLVTIYLSWEEPKDAQLNAVTAHTLKSWFQANQGRFGDTSASDELHSAVSEFESFAWERNPPEWKARVSLKGQQFLIDSHWNARPTFR